MNQLKDIKKHILSVLNGGEILLIIPPFILNRTAVLGPHILQSLAEEAGYKTEILYLNILLASMLGEQSYDEICCLPTKFHWMMAGERLFARSAYGLPPLGQSHELFADEAMNTTGNRQRHVQEAYASTDFDVESLLKIEELCTSFVNEVVQVIASLKYKIIGCATMLEQTNSSIAMLNGIKRIHPTTLTIIGGANCDGVMAEGIASLSDSIDYVFSGESETSFRMFLKGHSEGKLPSQRIIYGEPLKDLNTLACPNYDSFFTQMRQFFKENAEKQMTISYETSRGCWWGEKQKCSFCGLHDDGNRLMFRQKTEEKMLKDLEGIVNGYPVTDIMMTDNIMPHSYYKKLFPVLSEKNFPAIWYEEKANLKLQDLIQLKQTRVNSTQLGIESLSTNLLKLMNKGVSARQNLFLLRNALSVGISVKWYMLWGFPGDKIASYKEILKLLPLIRHFQPPLEFVHLRLIRFGSYVKNPEYYQITNLQPFEIYKKIYPNWSETDKLSFYFSGEYPCEAHKHPEIIQEMADEIAAWKKSWKKSTLFMMPFNNYYMVYDSRGEGKGKSHILEYSQAKAVMTYGMYTESEDQQWAVEEKLGVVVDSWYVPLVTASPELLLQFEAETSKREI